MTTKTQIKNFQKQLTRLSSGVITEADIRSLKMALNPAGSLTDEMKAALLDAANCLELNITPDQSKKGIEYLRNKLFKKNGKLRNISYKYFPEDLQHFEIDIIRNFKKFTFCGFINISENFYKHYVPIYKVIAKNGSWFTYTGTNFENIEVIQKHYEMNPNE